MTFKGTAILILLSAMVIFTAQNYETVEVTFMVWSFQTSRALMIFSAMFIGVILGWLTARRKVSTGAHKEKDASDVP